MKHAKKSNEPEPTISDVMGAIQGLTVRMDSLESGMTVRIDNLEGSVQDLAEAMQNGFAKVEDRFDKIESTVERHGKILTTLHQGQELVSARVGDFDRRLIATQSRVEDIAEILEDMTDVVDESRDQVFDHEIRIKRIEEACV